MIGRKRAFSTAREKQLAAPRPEGGQPERLTLPFACAATDQDFIGTFARSPQSRVFTCERVELNKDRLGRLKRLQARFGRGGAASVGADEIDFRAVICGGCGARDRWIFCDSCAAHVCDSRSTHHFFNCRISCGATGDIVPLSRIEAAKAGVASARAAIGHSGVKALPLQK